MSKGPDPYKPFRDLVSLQDRMSRLFEETIRQRQGEAEVDSTGFTPAVDIYEEDQHLVVALELPGVERQAVRLRVENNILSVEGERQLPPGVSPENFHRQERAYGRFSRSFTLPAGVDQSAITAAFSEGVLVIRVPRQEEARSRLIEIS